MTDLLDRRVIAVPRNTQEIIFTLQPNADTKLGVAECFWCPDDPAVAARHDAVQPRSDWRLARESIVNGGVNQFAMVVQAAPAASDGRRVIFDLTLRTETGEEMLVHRYEGLVAPDKLAFRVTDLLRLQA